MQLLQFLAHLLLSVTLGTLVVALAAYVAHKSRNRRRPGTASPPVITDSAEPVFLRREMLAELEGTPNRHGKIDRHDRP